MGKTPPLRTAHPKDPSVICSYQADLEKERQVDTVHNVETKHIVVEEVLIYFSKINSTTL